ncbi:hypothetical protein MNNICLKF_00725 [Synechococcus sp. CBW1107]|nr:hypothetical protein MNNICLKF_00725 [Synechococcus sp. CBW1107]
MSRRRYPGDGLPPPTRKVPNHWSYRYLVFWKDPANTDGGSIWLWCSQEMCSAFGVTTDAGIPIRLEAHRPSLVQARGINWTATWEDGSTHRFKASPQATKTVMAQIAQRWSTPPVSLQKGTTRPFDLISLMEESHSHVYLVRLLTFDPTADGRAYFKIGKAISIPKRIKQFGPCELIAEARFPSEADSLKAEANLHQQFSAWRKPETEIFCFDAARVEAVAEVMTKLESGIAVQPSCTLDGISLSDGGHQGQHRSGPELH